MVNFEISTLICEYVNELFEIREKYMLPVLDCIMNLKPVCTRLNRTVKIPEYLKDYVCLHCLTCIYVFLCYLF